MGLVGMVISSVDKGMIEVNEEFCRTLGYEREELLRLNWPDFTHPDDVAADVAQFNRMLAGEIDGYKLEKRFLRKDGRAVWGLVSVKCARKPDGAVDYVLGMFQEMTERKRTEDALRESESRLKLALRAAKAGVWDWDIRTGEIFWSPENYDLFGLDPAKKVLSYPDWESKVHPADLPRVQQVVRETVEGKREIYEAEYRVLQPGQGERWILGFGLVERDKEGQPRLMLGLNVDLTRQKQTEEALRNISSRFSRTLETSGTGLTRCSRDLHYLSANPAYARMVGLAEEEIVGRPIREVLGEKAFEKILPYVKKVLLGERVQYEMEVPYATSGSKYLHVVYTPNFDEQGEVNEWVASVIDITERKQVEDALKASEERYRLIFDKNPDGIFSLDAGGRFVMANPACEKISGYTREELRQKTFPEVCAPDRLAEAMDAFTQVLQTRGHVELETAVVHKTGRRVEVWVAGEAVVVGGKVAAVHCAVKDITELKRSQQSLRESQTRLMLAQQAARLGVYDYNLVTGELTWDARLREIWGLNAEDPVSYEVFLARLHPEDRERTDAAVRGSFKPESQGKYYAEYRVINQLDGQTRWIVATGQTFFEEQRAVRLIGIVQDITERRHAEDSLRQSEALLRNFAYSIPNPLFIKDTAGRMIFANPATLALHGKGADSVLGKTASEALDDPATGRALEANDREVMASGSTRVVEETIPTAEGPRTFIVTKTPFRNADGQIAGVIGAAHDITERKAVQEILARSKEQLEQIVAERTEKLKELVNELEHFSYTITHDMRAPLRAMRGYAELAQEMAAGSNAEQKAVLRHIVNAADRMDLLITDALSYSRALREELPVEPLDVAALLREMLDTYPEFQRWKEQITLSEDIPWVLGNRAGLTQCFSNLLGNAIKFTRPETAPEIRVTAKQILAPGAASQQMEGHRVRIYVEDNGVGISATMLPRVFNMFTRGNSPQSGTGIGLALVRKVVDRMGGLVGVESEPGKGSRFWIELRAAKAVDRLEPVIQQ